VKPKDVFTAPKFDWSRYLQFHITHGGVNVSQLHPIMGLRLAALFISLTNDGYASLTPGRGGYQILSGVRTRAEQIYLYNKICLQEGRCSMVANPYHPRSSGPDAEGVLRHGSNHMAQRQSGLWALEWGRNPTTAPVELGYAVDITTSVGWGPLHSRAAAFGLDWPLKGSPFEPWHFEAHPDRSTTANGWLAGPWPRRPGIHRPLFMGLKGGDVAKLQRQLGIRPDGAFGPGTRADVRTAQRTLNRILPKTDLDIDGVWGPRDQRAFERAVARKKGKIIRERIS
jgi:hypothetical protein